MTTKSFHIEVRGTPVEIVRKNIKNLHVGVYPPNGRVRVAVPLRIDDGAVRLAIVSRLGWIRRQQNGFAQQVRQSQREIATGESHYFWGRRYRLHMVEHEGPPSVRVSSSATMELRVRPGFDRGRREAVLHQWYRAQLRATIPSLLAKWESKLGVVAAEVRIKRMKTRWGSCNASARRIWLNLELAKKTSSCLEYILVHEMVHILERRHNARFRELMGTLMPTWRLRREELNRAPLAHEEWRY